MMKQRIEYISIINAIAIIAVMIGHLDVTGVNQDPNTPIANVIEQFGSFQMPLFMCVSGFLFTMTSGYKRTYADLIKNKVKRLLIPFLFLSLFTFAFKLCLPSSMLEHGVGFNANYIFKIFFVPFRGPVPHLWFVISLFTIFLLSPILKKTVQQKTSMIGTFLVLALLTFTPAMLKIIDFEYLAIDKTLSMLLWFYLGMVMQIEKVSYKLDTWNAVGFFCVIYIILLYFIQIPIIGSLACALSGILFVFSLAHKIADYKPNLFGSWRNYTYQIYLMHMYPIMVCKYLYKIHLFPNDDIWFVSIWISSLICSIALPTIVSKVVEKTSNNLKILIGL